MILSSIDPPAACNLRDAMITDHELMKRCGDGDMAALEDLVRRWESRVDAVLCRLVACPSEASDLKQETFVRVLTASGRYQANGAFSTWLYRIVLNLARDNVRRSKRRRVSSLSEHEPPDRNGSATETSEREETRELVDAAIRALPAELKEVVVLRHHGEMPFSRIALLTGNPESTVKSRMQKALKRLHIELEKQGVVEGESE